jgi:hypothetical protein
MGFLAEEQPELLGSCIYCDVQVWRMPDGRIRASEPCCCAPTHKVSKVDKLTREASEHWT